MECLRALRRPRQPQTADEGTAVLSFAHYPDMPAPTAASRHVSLPSGEFDAMAKMVSALEPELRSRLVSHRGFHDADGTQKERPIENTTAAYREAFRAGMPMAECDITLTCDGHLILCHDSTLRRLAEDLGDPRVDGAVTSLTLAELLAVSLKRGERVSQLDDVLAETEAQGAKLVIEVKTGADGEKISDALCAFFRKCPHRLEHTAVVMSFDFNIITRFARHFRADREERRAVEEVDESALPKLLLLLRTSRRRHSRRHSIYWELDWQADDMVGQLHGYMERASVAGAPLDGLYIQMSRQMVEEEPGREAMRVFASEHVLGVWGGKGDPDDAGTCRQLIGLGAHFVNTDLPLDFADARERSAYDDPVAPLVEDSDDEGEGQEEEEQAAASQQA